MADFFSPLRARIGSSSTDQAPDDGKPCWLGVRVALPALYISPVTSLPDEPPEIWLVEMIVNGRWESARVSFAAMPGLLAYWRGDPERALREWFGCEAPVTSHQPPSKQSEPPAVIEATAEELDL